MPSVSVCAGFEDRWRAYGKIRQRSSRKPEPDSAHELTMSCLDLSQEILNYSFFRPNLPLMPIEIFVPVARTVVNSVRRIAVAHFSQKIFPVRGTEEVKRDTLKSGSMGYTAVTF